MHEPQPRYRRDIGRQCTHHHFVLWEPNNKPDAINTYTYPLIAFIPSEPSLRIALHHVYVCSTHSQPKTTQNKIKLANSEVTEAR